MGETVTTKPESNDKGRRMKAMHLQAELEFRQKRD
jgi:hypothetical protein